MFEEELTSEPAIKLHTKISLLNKRIQSNFANPPKKVIYAAPSSKANQV